MSTITQRGLLNAHDDLLNRIAVEVRANHNEYASAAQLFSAKEIRKREARRLRDIRVKRRDGEIHDQRRICEITRAACRNLSGLDGPPPRLKAQRIDPCTLTIQFTRELSPYRRVLYCVEETVQDPLIFPDLPPAHRPPVARRVILLLWILTDPLAHEFTPTITDLQLGIWESTESNDPDSYSQADTLIWAPDDYNRFYAREQVFEHLPGLLQLATQAMAIVEATRKRAAPPSGNRSRSMSLAAFARTFGMDYRTFKNFAEITYDLHLESPKRWTIDLDRVSKSERQKLERGACREAPKSQRRKPQRKKNPK